MISSFSTPLSVRYSDRLYLSGYSYFKVQESQTSAASAFVTKEETDALHDLRWAITCGSLERIVALLDQHPELPRLLSNSSGRFDQETHELLFSQLLFLGRVLDLQRLYAVMVTPWDEAEAECQLISQREVFGTRFSLIHENISVARSEEDSYCGVRAIPIHALLGKGSFGFVFNSDIGLIKYNTIMAEYVRETLSYCALTITRDDTTPHEIENPYSVTSDMIQHHLLALHPLSPMSRESAPEHAAYMMGKLNLSPMDQLLNVVRVLLLGIRALRDRFIIHMDLSVGNVMWDPETGSVRLIDYAGTIGDDSFLDIGIMVDRVCTRSSRAPEYGSSDTLWQRNESSEALCGYYAIMNHIFPQDFINQLPYSKEAACKEQVSLEIEGSGQLEHDSPLHLRRLHQASISLPRDRPSLDWLVSDATEQGDRQAIEMGSIGSQVRYAHVKTCMERYMTHWPRGITNELNSDWKLRRSLFIKLLLSRIDCPGTDGTSCGGLLYRVTPPPYTTVRCILLYDALRDLAIQEASSMEDIFIRYLTDLSCYPILVNAVLYISLAPSKATLIEVEHYYGHPVHVILRVMVTHPELSSLFLSPITVYILTLLETPRIRVNDQNAEAQKVAAETAATTTPRAANSHRLIRCLYNLRRDRRSQPMSGSSLARISNFVRNYMTILIREPIVVAASDLWWEKLFNIEALTATPQPSGHVENLVRLWFS